MRHQRAGVHLSRTAAHRKALFSNLVAALFTHGRIRTTDAKAKETRRLAERTITWARRLGDVLTKEPEKRSPEEKAQVVHAIRMARRVVRDRHAVLRLFDELGPRYLARRGGYTRIVKIGQRPGDAAPMSILELVDYEFESAGEEAPAAKGEGKSKASEGKKAAEQASGGGATAEAAPKKTKSRAKASAKAEAGEGEAAAKPRASRAKSKKAESAE
jgi:large subunit ribosomal protein L17